MLTPALKNAARNCGDPSAQIVAQFDTTLGQALAVLPLGPDLTPAMEAEAGVVYELEGDFGTPPDFEPMRTRWLWVLVRTASSEALTAVLAEQRLTAEQIAALSAQAS